MFLSVHANVDISTAFKEILVMAMAAGTSTSIEMHIHTSSMELLISACSDLNKLEKRDSTVVRKLLVANTRLDVGKREKALPVPRAWPVLRSALSADMDTVGVGSGIKVYDELRRHLMKCLLLEGNRVQPKLMLWFPGPIPAVPTEMFLSRGTLR